MRLLTEGLKPQIAGGAVVSRLANEKNARLAEFLACKDFCEYGFSARRSGYGHSRDKLGEIMKDNKGPDDIHGPDGLLKQLSKALIERAGQSEIVERRGYEKSERVKKQTTTGATDLP